MARYLRYVLAGLLCVVTAPSVPVAWAAPQKANPQQPAPVESSKPLEIPLDQLSSGQMLTRPQDCFTMRVAPADPNIDKRMAQRPPDGQTNFTMRNGPAPSCVVPGVTGASPKVWTSDYPDLTNQILPTNRGLNFRSIPIFPFPTLPLFPPVIPQATPGQDGTAPR